MILTQSLISNSASAFPWVSKKSNLSVKGYIYEDDVLIKNEALYDNVFDRINEYNYFDLIKGLDGFYGLILDSKTHIVAATDLVNSTPIFYKIVNNEINIGDDYEGFIEKPIKLDQQAIDQYLVSGYCYNDKTLIQGVSQLPPGSILIVDKFSKKYEILSYYKYVPEKPCLVKDTKSDINMLIEELYDVHFNVFKKMVGGLNGKKVILPLSGGYDSRLILEMLKKFNYDNVLCVTWGKESDWQVKIAKKVALDFNVDWKLITTTRKEWHNWYINNFEKEMKNCGAIGAIPYLQENVMIEQLEKENLIHKGDIFISGNSGDFIEGEHIPVISKESLDNEAIIKIIKNKHQRLNSTVNSYYLEASLNESINYFRKEIDIDIINFFEFWEWKERQAKFVTNCVKPFETKGYEWRMPFWNKEIMEFWQGVDIKVKAERYLFYKYSEKYMDQVTSKANPKLSIFKRYSERLLDPRFGCYTKISTISYTTKNINKYFPKVDVTNINEKKIIYYKFNSLVAMDVVQRLQARTF